MGHIDEVETLVMAILEGITAIRHGNDFKRLAPDWSMTRLPIFGGWYLSIGSPDARLLEEAGEWLRSRDYQIIKHALPGGLIILIRP